MRDFTIQGSYQVENDIPYIDEDVVFLGAFSPHWGHFLMDMLVRVWYICDDNPHNIVYMKYPDGNPHLQGTFRELFDILGVQDEQLFEIDCPTRFRTVIVPEISYNYINRCVAQEYVDTFDFIKAKVRLKHKIYDKVYFARTRDDSVEGEQDIIMPFKRQGYKVVYPLKMSLREQIWYWKNCKFAVVSSGSMAHNIVFAQNKVKLTIINVDQLNMHQVMLNQIRDASVTYVDCRYNLLPYKMARVFFITDFYVNYMRDVFGYKVRINVRKEVKKLKDLFIKWLMLMCVTENSYSEYTVRSFDNRYQTNIGRYYIESRRNGKMWKDMPRIYKYQNFSYFVSKQFILDIKNRLKI